MTMLVKPRLSISVTKLVPLKILRSIIVGLVICVFFVASYGQFPKVATAKKIIVAAHPLAAKAGVDVYNKGGNVVDAAVATAYALGVVEPYGSGIGGEGMMLIYLAKEHKAVIVDFKAISPKNATYQNLDFNKVSEWNKSVKGASIPGVVAGLELARERFGKLDRKTVIQPAIDYALNGFEVDSSFASNLSYSRKSLEKDPYSAKVFFPKAELPTYGTILKNPDYGKTLKLIQEKGASAFYEGEIAKLIVNDATIHDGFITLDDLKAYKPIVREPLMGEYRGYQIITTPPPCGGMLLLETFNILKYFNLPMLKERQAYALHLMAETFKLMYKDEAAFNGDPEFNRIAVQHVSSPEFALQRLSQINLLAPQKAADVKSGGNLQKNTTHLSVMDAEGNVVALTITLSSLFGTTHTVEGAGFLLNNEMQNFNIDSTHLNNLQPHKRVVTSLVPTILMKDGKPFLVTGTPGGDLIISSVAQIIINVVDFGMSLPEAMYAPRIFSTFYQDELEMENRFPQSTVDELTTMGYKVNLHGAFRAYFGAAQSIMYDAGKKELIGVSDPRRSGAPIGE
jgi:gamma-glutamyltranspeptidase/glutathione hydrolase